MFRFHFRSATLLLLGATLFSCSTARFSAKQHTHAIDSSLIQVELPSPQLRYFNDSTLLFSNAFAAARLNEIRQLNDSTFELTIRPENAPINPSPWFGFKVWSQNPATLHLTLRYGDYRHRYHPKISLDGEHWEAVKTLQRHKDRKAASFSVQVRSDTLQVSAQERIDAAKVYAWMDSLAELPLLREKTIGYSILGQPIVALSTAKVDSRRAVLFLSRQHPPEVTGFLAYQAFMDEVFSSSDLARRFRTYYQILTIPMVNPDGVDAGHWRHNMGGVDLNRDWEGFKQPETRAIRDYLEQLVAKNNTQIYFALDFHSTFHDVYYINENVESTFLPGFSEKWIGQIEQEIPGYEASVKPSSNGGNVSKGWLSRRFGTEAITYEVGDTTPRKQVEVIARTAAQRMMTLLLEEPASEN